MNAINRHRSSTSGAGQSDVRRTNRRLILQRLRDLGPLSRADLAREISLTPAAVSAVVRDLMDDELIEDVGRNEGSGGKPARLLALNPDAVHIVAIDVSQPGIVVGGTVNLAGKVTSRHQRSIEGLVGAPAAEAVVELAVFLSESAERPVIGVGVGVPGIVAESGTVITGSHLVWNDLDLAPRIELETGHPTVVVNDANAAAFGEVSFGRSASDNLVLVKVDAGVGAGLVLNRQPFTGDTFAAGEFGHVVIEPSGASCACGKRGCVETVVSEPLLEENLAGFAPMDVVAATVQAGIRLGEALSLIVGVLNVHDIVVSGSDQVVSEAFRNAAAEEIASRSMALTVEALTIRPSVFGLDDVLMGAAGLVLNEQLGLT